MKDGWLSAHLLTNQMPAVPPVSCGMLKVHITPSTACGCQAAASTSHRPTYDAPLLLAQAVQKAGVAAQRRRLASWLGAGRQQSRDTCG